MTVAVYVPSCDALTFPPVITWNESGGCLLGGPAAMSPNASVKRPAAFVHRPFFRARCVEPNATLAFADPHSINTLAPPTVPGCGQTLRCADALPASTAATTTAIARTPLPIGAGY